MPATYELVLPRLGETMEEGTVVAWLKQEGETFARGETIAEIETDKTVVELPALETGTLVKILTPPGTKLSVGMPLALLSGTGSSAAKPTKQNKRIATKKARPTVPATKVVATSTSKHLLASPNARRMARELRVALATVPATGRRGRRTAADVTKTARGKVRNKPTLIHDANTGLALQHWAACPTTDPVPWLLIHGLFGNSMSWSGLVASLTAAGTDVYTIDLPGHGQSKMGMLEPTATATAIRTTLRNQYLGPVRVAGISLGGLLATELATIDDNLVSLHLLCPAGLGKHNSGDFIKAMLAAAHGADITPALAYLGKTMANLGPEAIKKMQAELMARANELENMAKAWFPQDGELQLSIIRSLQCVNAPVKVLFGLDDSIIPWQHATNLPDHVAAYFLAAAGHMPHLDQPNRVLAFLTT